MINKTGTVNQMAGKEPCAMISVTACITSHVKRTFVLTRVIVKDTGTD